MKKLIFTLLSGMICSSVAFGQTYVNEMTKVEVERDCYIEGGGVIYNDEGPAQYEDLNYVQKASNLTPTSFIFNMDLCDNHNLTGFKVNMLLRLADTPEDWVKIEYSTDERTYLSVPDMHVDVTYEPVIGNAYWTDVYYQAALPAGTKEIKVTLLAKADDANWIPCYRRTEIFYATGKAYAYETPPNLIKEAETFSVDFETEGSWLASTAGSENPVSFIEVVDNPKIDAVNGSARVLKITQAPSTPEEWGWGNGDWFGASVAVNDNDSKQVTKITEQNKFLHFSIYRTNNTQIGMETWGGSAGLKNQYEFTVNDGWKEMVIDLTEYIGKTFDSFYYSPNVLFETNNIQEAEISYIDNIYLSGTQGTGISPNFENEISILVQEGGITVNNALGANIEIFNISGILIKKAVVSENTQTFPLQQGIYIVKTGKIASKVAVMR